MRLSVTVYPPGNHTMVPTGTRSDILKAPAELHPGPLYKSSQDPISSRKDPVRGGESCVLSLKYCPRFLGGSRQGPRRAPAGLFTGLIRGIFLAGARVTFKLELKVARGPPGVKKWTAPGRGPSWSRAGRPKTARELPGKAPFVKCDQGMGLSDTTRLITFTYFKTFCFVFQFVCCSQSRPKQSTFFQSVL